MASSNTKKILPNEIEIRFRFLIKCYVIVLFDFLIFREFLKCALIFYRYFCEGGSSIKLQFYSVYCQRAWWWGWDIFYIGRPFFTCIGHMTYNYHSTPTIPHPYLAVKLWQFNFANQLGHMFCAPQILTNKLCQQN